MPYLHTASQRLLQSNIAVHTNITLHPAAKVRAEAQSCSLFPCSNCVLPTGAQELGSVCQLVSRCSHGGQWGPERGPLAVAAQDRGDNRGLQRYLSHSLFCCFLFACLSI